MHRMYSTQAISHDEMCEISYILDHCLLYKQAEEYLGHKPFPIESSAAILIYMNNAYLDDLFEPFDSFLRWTQIGAIVDSEELDDTKRFSVEIPIIRLLFDLAAKLGPERQTELETFQREFQKKVCDFDIDFLLEEGLVNVYVGFMTRLNWHEVVPSFLKYLGLAKELCVSFQKELDSL